ncbi:MAG: WD40 domain-containing protein, partial [Planctomycetota bacterium]
MNILVDPNGVVDVHRPSNGEDMGVFSWSANESDVSGDKITTLWKVNLPDLWLPMVRTAAAIALSPDLTTLAFGDRDGTIRTLDVKSSQLRHTHMPAWCGEVHSLRLSSDGKVLATSAGSGTICLWDTQRWQPLRKFEADTITNSFPLGGNVIAWGKRDAAIARLNEHRDSIEILDSQSGQVLRILSGNSQGITSVLWSPDSMFLIAGTINGKVLVWDVKSDSDEPATAFDAHAGSVNALAWHSQSQNLITTGDDGKIQIWEPRSGKLTRSIEGYPAPIICLALSPEGNVLAAGSENGIIRLWDAANNWTSVFLRGEPNDFETGKTKFTAITWSPDGTFLASGDSMCKIRIWDLKSRRPLRSFSAQCGSISSLAWSADGRMLICGGADGTAWVWDVKNDFQDHVVLLPLWDSAGPGIAINREGDYRGSPGIAEHLIYIVSTEQGQETMTPADFKSRFGWVNEPWQVGLYSPGSEQIKRIYVKADAQPPYDGNSWDTAFNDLQDALSIAQPNTDIWVAAGIYRPDRGTGAREASFHLKNGVRLFGGFSGTETSINQRDPNQNQTILSGDLNGDDGPDFANNDENSYHVVISIETDEKAFLDGFTITSGNADGPSRYRLDDGGGMFGSGATIIGCIFRLNSAVRGGAVYGEPGKPTFVNCTFTENKAVQGGGIHFRHLTGGMLVNCNFVNNSVDQYGGGIYTFQSYHCTLTNCSFITNKASYHGGAIWSFGSKAIVSGNTFRENSADVGGGGVYLTEDASTFIECTFIGNFGPTVGGGLLCEHPYSDVVLTNCKFLENNAHRGGGVWIASCSPRFNNCLFYKNMAV